VYISGYRTLRSLSKEGGFTVKPVLRRGVPFFLWGIRRRYVLMLGMAACLAAVWLSGLFIWQIEVTGNNTVPSDEILANLRRLGVGVGTGVFSVDRDDIQNRMLMAIPELSWITVNTYGSRANVIVREKIEKPEIYNKKVPAEVYAGKTGIITDIKVAAGTPLCKAGDTVVKGDTVISSVVDSTASGQREVRADGEVWVQTFYEMSAEIPLQYWEKQYTGRESTHTSLVLGEKRGKLYFSGGNPYSLYDKITTYEKIKLPGGSELPVTVLKETFSEYEPVLVTLSEDRAEDMLRARLLSLLCEEIGSGTILGERYEASVSDDVMRVTLYAQCVEEVARTREK